MTIDTVVDRFGIEQIPRTSEDDVLVREYLGITLDELAQQQQALQDMLTSHEEVASKLTEVLKAANRGETYWVSSEGSRYEIFSDYSGESTCPSDDAFGLSSGGCGSGKPQIRRMVLVDRFWDSPRQLGGLGTQDFREYALLGKALLVTGLDDHFVGDHNIFPQHMPVVPTAHILGVGNPATDLRREYKLSVLGRKGAETDRRFERLSGAY